MSTHTTRFTVAVLLAAMLGSCTNIKNDGTRTRTEGALGGAILGALAGAAIGSLSGNAGRGALIGLAAGTAGGLAYGNHVAKKKANYASTEQWLDACISQARATNQKARNYNSSLSANITKLRSEIASAKSSGNTRVLQQKKAEIIKLQNESTREMKKVDSEIKLQQEVLGESSSSGLKQEVISLKSTRSSMSSNYDRLASLNREIDV
ncbi:glycine zipper domain-containing protein [Prosthecobacter sp.]|uniref:glycine zipper domain-containing protein n=1 Tax=Prosthecobacter sp. TaxID=1965333 RepID=UPI002AB8089F|nr:glycine zipper domain-containing protein [Prosthecobacter sp.]MDZ4405009.1 glycine zipper domain-containing protein [Prosthecobacter sp.]